jgi:uncharacterized protein (DUF952 family)
MNPDLIFHAVSRRKWPSLNKGGYYSPEDLSETGVIRCAESEGLNEYLNREFTGRKNLLLLVIDTSRLVNRPRKKDEHHMVAIEGEINLDAILDKIRIDCDSEGKFDLRVDSE